MLKEFFFILRKVIKNYLLLINLKNNILLFSCFFKYNIHEFDSGSERMLSVCLTHASFMFVFMILNIAYGCKIYKYFALKFDNVQLVELISNIKKRK